MVDHVIDAQMREAQGGMIVVQLQRAHARGVGLEGEDQDVAHEPHVFGDVLRDAVGGAAMLGVRAWAASLAIRRVGRRVDALLDFADRIEIFIELALIAVLIWRRTSRASSRTASSTLVARG